MRQRNKPWAKDYLANESSLIIRNDTPLNADYSSYFGNLNPIYLEIGTGKGDFIVGMAALNPNKNFIGIEIQPSVLVIAEKKIRESKLTNVRIINLDASKIQEFFQPKSISRIYLNFSDPWPKKRHAKRRLTSPQFLSIYNKVLVDNGDIHMKTDNMELYLYSLITFSENPWKITLNDCNYQGRANDIQSEYEKRFRALGNPIFRIEVSRGE